MPLIRSRRILMDELLERLTNLLADLPIGLIIFIVALLFSFFNGDKKQPAGDQKRMPRQDEAPQPAMPADDTSGRWEERREADDLFGRPAEERPAGGYIFASDERKAREKRERQDEEVLVFGGLDFGRQGSLFEDEGDRDSQWGKTKYGFDDSEWSSESQWGRTFEDKKDSEPIIR